jgi:hypothetical protein
MLKLSKHPRGPDLPESAKNKHFTSYVGMANWAEVNLPSGLYWSKNPAGKNLATAVREVRCKLDYKGNPQSTGFWVEGRGHI